MTARPREEQRAPSPPCPRGSSAPSRPLQEEFPTVCPARSWPHKGTRQEERDPPVGAVLRIPRGCFGVRIPCSPGARCRSSYSSRSGTGNGAGQAEQERETILKPSLNLPCRWKGTATASALPSSRRPSLPRLSLTRFA